MSPFFFDHRNYYHNKFRQERGDSKAPWRGKPGFFPMGFFENCHSISMRIDPKKMAERQGFEPWVRKTVHLLSRQA